MMNFTPFGGPFPGTIPSIHQFTSATGALASSTQTIQDTNNRYHNSTVNMTHFNQPLAAAAAAASIPTKFRPDDTNTIENKYNGHIVSTQQQYSSIPYSQQSDDKRLIASAISYPQSTITSTSTSSTSGPIQSQPPQEITQDLCNAILQQQTVDTKRGKKFQNFQKLFLNFNPYSFLMYQFFKIQAGNH